MLHVPLYAFEYVESGETLANMKNTINRSININKSKPKVCNNNSKQTNPDQNPLQQIRFGTWEKKQDRM